MFWIARTILAITLAACAPQGAAPDSVPAPAASVPPAASGIVRIVGSAPVNVQVVLQPETGGTIRLTGPLRAELENLAGANVAVFGELTPSPDPLADRELRATGYEILEIDGQRVLTGEIVALDGSRATLRQSDGTEVPLVVPVGVFRVGQRVWVQGPSTVTVQSFGVLRP